MKGPTAPWSWAAKNVTLVFASIMAVWETFTTGMGHKFRISYANCAEEAK
jgi:hypothetical protein